MKLRYRFSLYRAIKILNFKYKLEMSYRPLIILIKKMFGNDLSLSI